MSLGPLLPRPPLCGGEDAGAGAQDRKGSCVTPRRNAA